MSTYKQIQDDVKATHGVSVKTCWIAHVKSLNGLPVKVANNRQSPDKRVYPCPDNARLLIEESMKKFGML